MNERIKELAEQAMSDVQEKAYPEERSWGMDDVMEKFAELIIRECADIADTAEPYKSNDLILKHFGVEE